MIYQLKKLTNNIFRKVGYDLVSKKLYESSDDPFYILSLISDREKICVVVDGGASIGDTSQSFSDFFPNAIVYAFEPYPEFIKCLEVKSAKNPKIHVEPFALSSTSGKEMFMVNKSKGTNSLLTGAKLGKSIYGEQMEKQSTIEVYATTLDTWVQKQGIDKIDILKLDLQGGELEALKGSASLLENGQVSMILCEVILQKCYVDQPRWYDIVSLVEGYGYRLLNLYQPHFHLGSIIQADFIFVHSKMKITDQKFHEVFHQYSHLIKNPSS